MARVEGETAIKVKIAGGRAKELVLKIFEPPRFFEGFLVGRRFDEVPDLVSRICGICPVSHMTTALRALEKAMGLNPTEQTRALRRLMAWSQVTSSHLVHLYMLAFPDYFGYQSITEMVPSFNTEIKRLMKMKQVMNDLTAAVGGRALHPVSAVVNGFTSLPSKDKLDGLYRRLRRIKDDAAETARMVAELPYPDFQKETEYVAISNPAGYAINEGKITSNLGLGADEDEYGRCFQEEQVPYANAKHSKVRGRGSLTVGALARLNIKFDKLSQDAKSAAREIGFKPPDYNPFHNNIAQALEVIHGIDECLEILEELKINPEKPRVEVTPGEGGAVTEAPRGLLYHRYALNRKGVVEKANIVTPTSHNFLSIEESLKEFVETKADLPEERIATYCEMMVRAYDPCFSCSVH